MNGASILVKDVTWKKWIVISTISIISSLTCIAIYKRILSSSQNQKKKRKFIPILPSSISVQFIQSFEEAEKTSFILYQQLSRSKFPIVGFDIEWKPHSKEKRNRTALIQLCDGTKCYLFHIFHFGNNESVPPSLKLIMEDASIIKVGVGSHQDARILLGDCGIETKGTVELSSVSSRYGQAKGGASLSKLSKHVLGIEMDKNLYIRCSNWESKVLSPEQLDYAAADAWVAYRIFETIYSNVTKNSSRENKENLMDFCKEFIGRKPLQVIRTKPNSQGKAELVSLKPKRQHASRRDALYENCVMKSKEGLVLCTCNRKKLNWYLERNLADLVSEDPPTIVLRFQPNGTGHHGDEYYMGKKENRCVVCGTYENLVRHSVVPHSYRSNFEERYKSRSSHDIVLVCQNCMLTIGNFDGEYRRKIADRTGISVDGIGKKEIIDERLKLLHSRAKLLLSKGSSLPVEKIDEFKEMIGSYLGKEKDQIGDSEIEEILKRPYRYNNPDHISHDKLVVEKYTHSNQLDSFVREWRQHFVDRMQPKFLPEYWSISRKLEDR